MLPVLWICAVSLSLSLQKYIDNTISRTMLGSFVPAHLTFFQPRPKLINLWHHWQFAIAGPANAVLVVSALRGDETVVVRSAHQAFSFVFCGASSRSFILAFAVVNTCRDFVHISKESRAGNPQVHKHTHTHTHVWPPTAWHMRFGARRLNTASKMRTAALEMCCRHMSF